ncbi:hypothetical protein BGP80_17960 [Pseudomonas putida]|uniref:Uncharacterized protein n=1 Tax=Pseudomonas putida TaxID=303 RepID=A0A2S3WFK8_PSEPU|nr:hypothetical protein BGP80_17960 [Pseudomonas putida]
MQVTQVLAATDAEHAAQCSRQVRRVGKACRVSGLGQRAALHGQHQGQAQSPPEHHTPDRNTQLAVEQPL